MRWTWSTRRRWFDRMVELERCIGAIGLVAKDHISIMLLGQMRSSSHLARHVFGLRLCKIGANLINRWFLVRPAGASTCYPDT